MCEGSLKGGKSQIAGRTWQVMCVMAAIDGGCETDQNERRSNLLMKKALVCGAGGFIGGHPSTELRAGLVEKLKREGYWVRGVDIKEHEFAPTQADEFLLLDLREPQNCRAALTLDGHPSTKPVLSLSKGSGQAFDKVYQLAADMEGGSEWRLLSES